MTEQITGAEVVLNTPNKLTIYIYGPITAKKNNKMVARGRLMSGPRYLKWHKEMMDILGGTEWLFNEFPCKITITSIVGTRVKSDIDNATSSVLDLFTDLGVIPDDNRFVVPELEVINLGYAKNCFITKIVVEGYVGTQYDLPKWDGDIELGKELLYSNQ